MRSKYKRIENKRKKRHRKKKFKITCIYIFKIIIKFFILFFLLYLSNHFNIYHIKIYNYYYKRRMKFLRMTGRFYNESHLVAFSDKINWLNLHDVTKKKAKCADKILLHEYSKRILKKDICNKILKIYDDPYKMNFSELPDQFALKTNHGSSFNIIVHNKTDLNFEHAKKTLSYWLHLDYSTFQQEFHYTLIKRKAFVEEYLGRDINNYKFFCYDGIPRLTYVHQDINGQKYRTFFDMDWKPLELSCGFPPHPTAINQKPKNFELMKMYSRKLSKPFIFVRVDFYEFNNEVRLGELTFTPMNGYYLCNEKNDIELGKYLKLPFFRTKFPKLF